MSDPSRTTSSGNGRSDSGGGAPRDGVSRRAFMQTLGISAAASGAATRFESALAETARERRIERDTIGPEPFDMRLTVNGKPLEAEIDPATTLMEVLRWRFRLTGTKEVCDRGACGGCSVLVDGKLVNSCMMLAVDAIDSDVTTVEGVAHGDRLDPVQEAFIRHDALQCGYCTPGLVMASRALLDENPTPSLDDIRKGLSGNLCRCGTYSNVFNAVLEASGQKPIRDPDSGQGGE